MPSVKHNLTKNKATSLISSLKEALFALTHAFSQTTEATMFASWFYHRYYM